MFPLDYTVLQDRTTVYLNLLVIDNQGTHQGRGDQIDVLGSTEILK